MEQQEREGEGVVRQWYGEQGWGIVGIPHEPWDCFVHFSHIEQGSGYRELVVGERVDVWWVRQPQDEFDAVATRVRRRP